jgi:hypothetical protein
MPRRTTLRIVTLVATLLLGLPAAVATSGDPIQAVETFEWSDNMEPLGASLRPPPSSGLYNSDLAFWGKRAYQGTYDGFRVLDISDPTDPAALVNYTGCSGTSASNQGDVLIWNKLLIRSWNSPAPTPQPVIGTPARCAGVDVAGGFEGIHILDVTVPGNPSLVGSLALPCGSHTATLVPDLENNRLLVYNSASSSTCPQIDIAAIPLDNPGSPVHLGTVPAGRGCHDTAVILGDAMLAACAGGNGFTVFSIGGERGGSLTAPVQLYSKSLTGVSIGHAAAFSWDGSILVFGHEPGGGSAARCQATSNEVDKTLFFFEAASGTELGRWVLPRPQTSSENCTIHNFNVVPSARKNILVSGNYQSGIAVIDFTDPTSPREIAYADPAPLQPQQLGGDWSTYWYNGAIYESDITRGLITWRLNDAAVDGHIALPHANPQTQEMTIPFTGDPDTEPELRCLGEVVTIAGTAGADEIVGTPGADVIHAGAGPDIVTGGGGNDLICGGGGPDELRGNRGDDHLSGDHGNDRLLGGLGRDTCTGGPGKDAGKGCEAGLL